MSKWTLPQKAVFYSELKIDVKVKCWPLSVTAVQQRVLEEDPDVGSKCIQAVLLTVAGTTVSGAGHMLQGDDGAWSQER